MKFLFTEFVKTFVVIKFHFQHLILDDSI